MKLKSYFLLLIALTAFTYTLYGQTISVKAGINSSTMKGKPIPEDWGIKKDIKKTVIGPHAGLVIEVPLKEKFSLQTGLIFSHKGQSTELFFKDTTIQNRLYSKSTLYYLELPVTGKYSFRLLKNTDIYALAGLYLGFGVLGHTEYAYDLYGKDYAGEYEAWGNIKRTDAGAVLGVGFQMGSIGLEYSYCLGLADVTVSTDALADATFQVMKLGLTYRIWELK